MAAVTATRPDGVVFLALIPMALSLRVWMSRGVRSYVAAVGAYVTVAAMLLGALVVFRWLYFSDTFPNPYYMKGGPTRQSITATVSLLPETMLQVRDLAAAIAGHRSATWFLILVFAGTLFLASVNHFNSSLALLGLFSLFSGTVYLLLPPDWMPEYCFASPFFLFFYTYLVTLVWSFCAVTMRPYIARRAFALVLALLIVGTLVHVARRSVAFASNPTVALADVAEHFGHRYNRVAAVLGLEAASLLASDLGGTLLYSKLLVFDLGGLCDRTIARTIGKNQRAFHDYVFGRIKPTFIHLHRPWTELANLEGDERFRRDYVPIRETMFHERSVSRLAAGDFIRRDALRKNPVEPLADILAGTLDALPRHSK